MSNTYYQIDEYGNINMWTTAYSTTTDANAVSFAPYPYPQVECTVPCKSVPKSTQKKEKTMYVDNDKHIESSKINYLLERANSIYYKKVCEFEKQFGLVADEPPMTPSEMIKRIQDGKFVLKDEYKDKQTYDAVRYITWRDPSVKEDKEGFKIARKALEDAQRDALDAIAVMTPVEALAAIKTFEAWTYSAK